MRFKFTAAATLAAAALFAAPVAASASTPHLRTAPRAMAFQGPTFTAYTALTDRPDSGGNGNWAYDEMTRQLSITETGPGTYTATVTDVAASFVAIDGAYTPNQGCSHCAGETIGGSPSGSFSGGASYSFTADSLPTEAKNLGVPASESGAPGDFAETTSGWYEQAFPAGTVFGGAGIGNWGWNYSATVGQFPFVSVQTWADTSANGDGQLPADGNISGS